MDCDQKWKFLIAPDIVWELPFAPSLGHPQKLVGREQVLNHVGWFVRAGESFRFHDLRIQQFADPLSAVAQVKAQGILTETGKNYSQEYVLFVSVREGKLTHIRGSSILSRRLTPWTPPW